MNDLIHFAMERACVIFGDRGDGVFNSACFSKAFSRISGVRAVIDGWIVRAMFVGRDDVTPMPGGSHWRLKDGSKLD